MDVCVDRYRYVVTASIGNMPEQPSASVLVTSQCLWNASTDRYSKVSYMDEDETFYAVVIVFAVYLE